MQNRSYGETLEIVLDTQAPARFSAGAMGYATVGKEGTAIHVFYHRVRACPWPELTTALLGHVMVHEITHVLEDVARHSRSGVMKANFDGHDYDVMRARPLRFAAEDVELVQAHFGGANARIPEQR
ncbi:MAG: hypothetical protein LAP87_07940 [Acidobacteriia bacterium]|nr:hypothetical protein [Terriglobia bacterium]